MATLLPHGEFLIEKEISKVTPKLYTLSGAEIVLDLGNNFLRSSKLLS